jgi:hypothetical protein
VLFRTVDGHHFGCKVIRQLLPGSSHGECDYFLGRLTENAGGALLTNLSASKIYNGARQYTCIIIVANPGRSLRPLESADLAAQPLTLRDAGDVGQRST